MEQTPRPRTGNIGSINNAITGRRHQGWSTYDMLMTTLSNGWKKYQRYETDCWSSDVRREIFAHHFSRQRTCYVSSYDFITVTALLNTWFSPSYCLAWSTRWSQYQCSTSYSEGCINTPPQSVVWFSFKLGLMWRAHTHTGRPPWSVVKPWFSRLLPQHATIELSW